jgi:hypothetical protein
MGRRLTPIALRDGLRGGQQPRLRRVSLLCGVSLADTRDWTCGFISRADVADFLIKQIDGDASLDKTPVLMS